jgi:predicted CXXCH cytochrome family protein
MRKTLMLFFMVSFVLANAEAKLKKSMKKECLICHQNWLLEAKIKSPKLLTKKSLKAEDRRMCLTCHDGSIADDRLTFLGFSRHSHPVDTEVPKDFKMPKEFPLHKGKLYCATCHTPHTKTGSEKKLDYTFMREPNVNSALCIKCHEENRKKKENHPILNDTKEELTQREIRKIKLIGGKLSSDSKVLCESCHSPHRARVEKALIYPTEKSQLCIVCHEENLNSKEHPNRKTHPIHEKFPKDAKVSVFRKEKAITKSVECLTCHRTHKEKNEHLTVLVQSKLCSSCHVDEAKVYKTDHDLKGKLCSSCHVAHNAKASALWARKIPEKAYEYASLIDIKQERDMLCLSCHYGSMKVGKKTVEDIGLITHPTGKKVKEETDLPLDKKKLMRCATCHNPHYAYNRKKEGNFLREERLSLCLECHRDKENVKLGKHAEIDKKKFKKGDCKACHAVHKAKDFMLSAVIYSATSPDEPKIDGFCLACHDPNGMAEHKIRMTSNYEHPVGGKNESVNLPGKKIGCATCHEAHLKEEELLRIPVRNNSKLCLECHDSNSVEGTPHDILRNADVELSRKEREKIEKGGACSACHIPHNPKGKVLWSKKLGDGKTINERMCNSCHTDKGMAKDSTVGKITHPMGKEVKDVTLPMIDQFTGLPAKEGIRGVLDCATCHDPHNGADRKRLTRYAVDGESFLCTECHKEEASVSRSEHDMRVVKKNYRNALGKEVLEDGVCSACHIPHRAKGKFLWAFDVKNLDKNVVSNYCLNCHSKGGVGEKKVVKEYSHPSKDVIVRSMYRPGRKGDWITFNKNGKKVKIGGDITCATCHNPHRWSPYSKAPGKNVEGTVMNSFLRNKTIAGSICVDCHGIDALYRYKFFHDKRAHEENPSYR